MLKGTWNTIAETEELATLLALWKKMNDVGKKHVSYVTVWL